MLVLGLTGNIGCGKSSVSTIFMNHGIEIVDADIVARHIFEDLDLLNKVFSTYGETKKNEEGRKAETAGTSGTGRHPVFREIYAERRKADGK